MTATLVHGGPFARTAHGLFARGWHPIPLTGDKIPAVRGRTGYQRRLWTVDELDVAVGQFATNAVGVVMPDGVLGIDVDHYDSKTGGDTIARLEAVFGVLPATWHLRAEQRPARSARFLFRVPEVRFSEWLLNEAGGDVELLQPHHRHAVAAGTVHRSAGIVRWYRPDGVPVGELDCPYVDDLAVLPDAWVEALVA